MKTFTCSCGNRLFFENTLCLNCQRTLGFDVRTRLLLAITPVGQNTWKPDQESVQTRRRFRRCKNTIDHKVCNWLIPYDETHTYCLACRMNEMIPSLTKKENHALWASMEISKHRLLYTLLGLGLPVLPKADDPDRGLSFAFLEDQRTNRDVGDEHVLTGHANGLITVNLIEADHVYREAMRMEFAEPYRTLLGHFRHESGHYYWDLLINNTAWQNPFRELFGDERASYGLALKKYHADPPESHSPSFISRYAQSHPLEDWAETWAHYLHMIDTLETATTFGLFEKEEKFGDFDQMMVAWIELSIIMNSLNRSMGLYDAYPFILTETIIAKIRFVHQLLSRAPWTTQSSAVLKRLP